MIRTSRLEFEVNRKTGFVDALRYKGLDGWTQVIQSDDTKKGIFMKMLHDATYPGRSSIINGDVIDLEPVAESITIKERQDGDERRTVTIFSKGNLKTVTGEPKVKYSMTITAVDGEPYLKVDVELENLGGTIDEYVVEAGVSLPINLKEEKMVCTPGDRGIVFNSRYTYEYVSSEKNGSLIPVPDISKWGVFMIDQETPNSFRMWKAEDKKTNIVPMMYGKIASGWIGVEDGAIGVIGAYKDFADRSPAGLRVNAEVGEEIEILIHPYTARPVRFNGPGSEQIFGIKHEMVFYFYDGSWKNQDKSGATVERQLGKLWGIDAFPSEGDIREYDEDPEAVQVDLATGSAVHIVKNGVPFPQGEVTACNQVRLVKEGKEVPLQTDALAYWPDGSIKWLLLSFPLDGNGGYKLTSQGVNSDKCIPINVTTRLNTVEKFTLYYGAGTVKGQVESGIKIDKTEQRVTVDTGVMSFSIEKDGSGFLDEVFLEGRPIMAKGGGRRSFLDYIHTSEYDAGSATIRGECDPSSVTVDYIGVEEEGPIRAIIVVRGTYHNRGVVDSIHPIL